MIIRIKIYLFSEMKILNTHYIHIYNYNYNYNKSTMFIFIYNVLIFNIKKS
jgi:hypothetical protein